MTSLEMANLICGFIEEKKGKDIIKIEVDKISSLCDYFVVASGNSAANVKAIADNIEEKLIKQDICPKRIEGMREGRWIAMDYGDIIVHIFNDETRLFFNIEKIWEKGNISNFMQAAMPEKKSAAIKAADKKIKEAEVKNKEESVKEKAAKPKPAK